MRHPLDIVAMFAALWLLASMMLDAVTPKELTAITIAVAIGPAIVITAVFYYLRCPRTDFAVMFAALWLISDIAIAFVSSKDLPHFLIVLGFLPALAVGAVLHWQRLQRREQRLPAPSVKRS
ncbi:hypothetical protein [Bradyrhizobium sp. RDT46]|uniref:hypothetical protein n=1 Tax=Bradyrhizobium sp. RDT46 TaxID=3341829 RepID=UPI0035C67279